MDNLTLKSKVQLQKSQSLNKVDGNEGVILDFEQKYFRGLNETALFILELLSKAREEKRATSGDELLQELMAAFEVDETIAQKDVLEFLHACLQRNIIEVVNDVCER